MGNSMKIAGVTGLAAVIAGGGCAAYAFSDTVKNQVKMRFDDPQEYFEWVCDKNIADAADCAGSSWQRLADYTDQKKGVQYTLEYTPTEEIKDEIRDLISDSDQEVNTMLRQIVDHTESIGVRADGSMLKEGTAGGCSLLVNGEALISLDAFLDLETGDFGARIPELTSRWLTVDTETAEILEAGKQQKLLDFYTNPASYLSAGDVAEFVSDILHTAAEQLPEVQLAKSVDVTVADLQTSYAAFDITLTAEDAERVAEAVADKMRGDNAIRRLYVDELGILDAEDFDSEIDRSLAVTHFTQTYLTVYVDASGNIRGTSARNDDGDEVFTCIAKDGTAVAAECKASKNTEDYGVQPVGSAVFSGTYDGVLNGTLTCNVTNRHYDFEIDDYTFDTEEVTASFSDVQIVDRATGFVNGSVTVTVPELDPFTISLSSDGSKQEISSAVAAEGEIYGDVKVSFGFVDEQRNVMPDTNDRYCIDPDEGFEVSEYATPNEFNDFLKTLLVKLGVDEGIASRYAQSTTMMLYMTANELINRQDDASTDWQAQAEEFMAEQEAESAKRKADFDAEAAADREAFYEESAAEREKFMADWEKQMEAYENDKNAAADSFRATKEANEAAFNEAKEEAQKSVQEAQDAFNKAAEEANEALKKANEEAERLKEELSKGD